VDANAGESGLVWILYESIIDTFAEVVLYYSVCITLVDGDSRERAVASEFCLSRGRYER
jgi:hypothetical protein